MANRGKRLYQCQECRHKQFIHWIELNRAGRARCMACGSGQLEPASTAAKEDRLIGDLNLREYDERRGDIVKAKRTTK